MHEDVRKYYNDHVDAEDQRLDAHPFEIPVLLHFVNRYLSPGDHIFDVACGTGRIARELLNKGYFMGLNDLSDRNVALVKERLGSHRNILFIECSDALKSQGWHHQDRKWNAIFILGPLYHMISRERRLEVLRLAREHVRPGGYVFSAFMTRIAAMVYGLKLNPKGILNPDGAKKLWETGTDDRFVEATEWFTHAYFAHPEEVNPLVEQAGLEALHLAGVEGFFGERFELYHKLEEKLKRPWLDFIIKHCEDTHMIHQAKHLLSVAKNPGF
jgi:S-adenosylmethionine-dependent methyltransferase